MPLHYPLSHPANEAQRLGGMASFESVGIPEMLPIPFHIVFYGIGLPEEGLAFVIWTQHEVNTILDAFNAALQNGWKTFDFWYNQQKEKAGLVTSGLTGYRVVGMPNNAPLRWPEEKQPEQKEWGTVNFDAPPAAGVAVRYAADPIANPAAYADDETEGRGKRTIR